MLKSNTQITPETVGMLKAGDWLKALETTCTFCAGDLVQYEGPGPLGECMVFGMSWMHKRFTYIGPDLGDGWIGWSGGENPVPGMRVEIRYEDGTEDNAEASETAPWRSTLPRIIAFRPAASSPSAVGVGENKAELYERMQEVAKANGFDSLTQAIAEAVKAREATPAREVDSSHGGVYDQLLTLIHDRDHALRGDERTDPTEIDETVLEIMRITTPTPAPSAGDATVDWERAGPKLVEALETIKAGGSWQGDTASDALTAATPGGK